MVETSTQAVTEPAAPDEDVIATDALANGEDVRCSSPKYVCTPPTLPPVQRTCIGERMLHACTVSVQAYAGMSKGQIKKAKARAKAVREAAGDCVLGIL